MKIIAYVVAAGLILLGAVWILQGLNFLAGSPMTGHTQWAVYGTVLAIAGLLLIFWTRRKKA
jgi:LPXTG-motif cell wall-anchored protein